MVVLLAVLVFRFCFQFLFFFFCFSFFCCIYIYALARFVYRNTESMNRMNPQDIKWEKCKTLPCFRLLLLARLSNVSRANAPTLIADYKHYPLASVKLWKSSNNNPAHPFIPHILKYTSHPTLHAYKTPAIFYLPKKHLKPDATQTNVSHKL